MLSSPRETLAAETQTFTRVGHVWLFTDYSSLDLSPGRPGERTAACQPTSGPTESMFTTQRLNVTLISSSAWSTAEDKACPRGRGWTVLNPYEVGAAGS